MRRRRVTFVTGSRAEFGLMEHALGTLRASRSIELSIVATGMHLSPAHGKTINDIRKRGWKVDANVPWRGNTAEATAGAAAGLARRFDELQTEIALLVGDRVEAFSGAMAGHLSGRIVAHIHGGDRALGQSDDALRHAITKLAHLHFPATRQSANRLRRLGEDGFRVHLSGTPGLDGLPEVSAYTGEPFVLIALHPDDANADRQELQAELLVRQLRAAGIGRCVIVWPNNDPGWQGIARSWEKLHDDNWEQHRSLPRETFLRLLGQCVCLIGNSSSGILEAASLGTRVLNIGDRQKGRERSGNVVDVSWAPKALSAGIKKLWNGGKRSVYRGRNVYGAGNAGKILADVLAAVPLDDQLRRKLICY